MLESVYTSTKQLVYGGKNLYNSLGPMAYVRNWDAVLLINNYDIFKVFRDGTVIPVGATTSNIYYIPMNNGGVAYWQYFDGKAYPVCDFTCQPIYLNPLSNMVLPIGVRYIDTEFDIYVTNALNPKVYRLSDNTLLKTWNFGFSNYTYTCYAGKGKVMISDVSGKIVIYDLLSETVVLNTSVGATIKRAMYDCIHDIIIVVTSTGYVSIYTLNDMGNGLSAPVFIPAGNIYVHSGYRVKTRLTNASGVGIAGKWVNWSLSGVKGSLEKPYSITDEDGYAYNYYYGPNSPALLGSETIRVSCEV